MKRTVRSVLLLLLAVFVVLSVSSCDALDPTDALDKKPSGRVDQEEIYSSYELTEAALTTVYKKVPGYLDSYFWYSMGAAASDVAADVDDHLAVGQWNKGNATPSTQLLYSRMTTSDGSSFWGVYYAGIRKANQFLENVKPASAYDRLSEEEREDWVAEARVLRAYFHMELLRNYGAQDQGIPIADQVYPPDYDFSEITRASYDSTAAWIARECQEAAQTLPADRSPSEDGRATSAWAYAIKSRTLLYAASPLNNPDGNVEEWGRAAEAAKQVLDMDEYALYDKGEEPYYELFIRNSDGSSTDYREMIWQKQENDFLFNSVNAITRAGPAKAGLLPTQNLVDMYEMKNGKVPITGYKDEAETEPIINEDSGYDPENPYENRDSRLFQSVFYNGHPWGGTDANPKYYVETYVGGADGLKDARTHTRTGYYLRKFTTPAWHETLNAETHWVIFRLAEFYLNYAEALNEAEGPTGDVYEAVNVVRERAGQPPLPSGLSQSEMRQRIRRERTVELAFENHRFYDVRRWNILNETGKRVTGMRITPSPGGGDGPEPFEYERFVVEERQAWEDRYLVRPVPTAEITRLSSLEQHDLWK
jgi:hypothetical protein